MKKVTEYHMAQRMAKKEYAELKEYAEKHKEDMLKAYRKAISKGKLFDPDAWHMRSQRRR